MAAKRLSFLTCSAVAATAGSAAWLTGGALTLTSLSSGAVRVGVLPSLAWLIIWMAAAGVVVAIWRPRGDRFSLLILLAVLIAPWLPGPVPAAFYIWTGPLRGWLSAVVLFGLAAPALTRFAPHGLVQTARDPRRAPWLAAAIAACAYLAGAYQISPIIPTGDEPHYLVIAQSIAKDHDIRIENNHRRGDYHEYYVGDLKPDYLRRGVNGEIYSVHAPGLPFVVAPVLAVLGYGGVLTFLALVSAWGTALAWRATWLVTDDVAASWFGWASVALTAPFFFQSFVVYPDAPGAVLVMAAVLAALEPHELSAKRLLAIGAALAVLPWLHTRFVVAAAVLGLTMTARLLTRRADAGRASSAPVWRIFALLSTPLVSAVCWFGFFYVIYGSPDPRAPYGTAAQSDVANLWRGFIGLGFDQQFGLFPAAPVLLCAMAGFAALIRKSPRLTAELLLLMAPYGCVVGSYQMWWGGNSSPGRFIIPVVLPLSILAGVWFSTRRGVAGKLTGLGALAVSLLATITLAAVDRGILIYNFRDGSSRLLTWLSPLVNVTTGLPSVFQTSPSSALLHGLVWMAAVAATAALGVLVERRGGRPVAVAVTLGLAAVVSSSIALSIVWWDHGLPLTGVAAARSLMTPAAGTTAFLRQYDPDRQQIGVRYSPIRRTRARDTLADLELGEAAADPAVVEGPAVALFHLPAGTYAVEGTGRGAAPVTVTLDSGFGPQWAWPPGDSSETWQYEFRLPVPVRALLARSPASRRIAVRPVAVVGSSHRLTSMEPEHVARYGPALVFLLDGRAFMESGGAWIEGGGFADFVVGADTEAPIRLFVRNPPVANTVTLEGRGWREPLVLAPGEERTVPLSFPTGFHAAALRVRAARGARPIDFERGSTDTRYLGCWIETRP